LNVSISLELVALVLVLLVVSFAKANAAAPVSTTPNMNCVIMSITSKSICGRSGLQIGVRSSVGVALRLA
jgi:hypothetical protein